MSRVHSAASQLHTQPGAAADAAYLLASRKRTRRDDRYITFWRADRCGYAWSLPWAGRYCAAEADLLTDHPASIYPETHSYAVPLEVIEPLCTSPRDGDIDGNVGPVLRNTKAHWAVIEAHAAILKPTTPAEADAVGTSEASAPLQSPETPEGRESTPNPQQEGR